MMLTRHNLAEADRAPSSRRGLEFETALVNAEHEAETALSQITGYDSEDITLLEIGKETRGYGRAEMHATMESMFKKTSKGEEIAAVLAVPDESDHRAKFADWLELKGHFVT